MARYVAELEVPRAPDEVFAYLADFSSTAEWDPGVAEAERTSAGPVGVGSTFRVVSQFLGRRIELRYEITEFEAGRVVLRGTAPGVVSVDEITVTPAGDGARIRYDAQLALQGLRRLADPLLQLAFYWIGGEAVDGLRATFGAGGRQPMRRRRRKA